MAAAPKRSPRRSRLPAPPLVGVIMGSQSDWSIMRHAAETLTALGVPHETRIVSAHRTPERMYAYADSARIIYRNIARILASRLDVYSERLADLVAKTVAETGSSPLTGPAPLG